MQHLIEIFPTGFGIPDLLRNEHLADIGPQLGTVEPVGLDFQNPVGDDVERQGFGQGAAEGERPVPQKGPFSECPAVIPVECVRIER